VRYARSEAVITHCRGVRRAHAAVERRAKLRCASGRVQLTRRTQYRRLTLAASAPAGRIALRQSQKSWVRGAATRETYRARASSVAWLQSLRDTDAVARMAARATQALWSSHAADGRTCHTHALPLRACQACATRLWRSLRSCTRRCGGRTHRAAACTGRRS
jgi:hypothetical protein